MMEYDPEGWEGDIISFYFVEDEIREEYTREVFTVINILERLGGFLKAMVLVCSFLIYPINSF